MFSNVTRAATYVVMGAAGFACSVSVVGADGVTDRYVTAAPGDDGGSVVVGAGYSSSAGAGGNGAPSTSPLHCTYATLTGALAALMGSGPNGATDGVWVVPYCSGGGYVNPMRPEWVSNAQPAAATSPATVARQASARLPLPQGVIRMSPDARQPQIVNERTWLWIDPAVWRSVTATASVGAVSATATATPSQVVWSLGDGDRVTCDGPGVPYDASRAETAQDTSCTYVWPRGSATESSGTFTVSVTIVWHVSWTAIGAPGGGNLGSLSGPPSQVTVRVTEDNALNTAR